MQILYSIWITGLFLILRIKLFSMICRLYYLVFTNCNNKITIGELNKFDFNIINLEKMIV